MKRVGTLLILAMSGFVLSTNASAASANVLPPPPAPNPQSQVPNRPAVQLPASITPPALPATDPAMPTSVPDQPRTAPESTHRYQGIIERNVFNLKDPKDLPAPEVKKEPTPGITLTGITTFMGSKRAFLSIAAKPPAQPRDIMLTEGQRDGGLEVIAIDVENQTVKVDNHGVIETLDFLKNGAKVANISPPGAPGAPGAINPGAPGTPGSPLRQIPTRPIRQPIPPPPGAGQHVNPNAPNTGVVNPQTGQPIQSKHNLSLEEQTLLIELQREEMRMRNDPAATLLPPTQMTPHEGGGNTLPQ